MSLKEAIVRVLIDAGGPLHGSEICHRILDEGLWSTSGLTPCDTVTARLSTDKTLFLRTSKGVYDLASRHIVESDSPTDPPAKSPAASLTYLEAAEAILNQEPHDTSLHYRDLTDRALSQSLIAPKGLTPEATMSAQLGSDIQRRSDRGVTPRFVKTGRGMFKLAKDSTSPVGERVDQHNKNIRDELHQQIKAMDAHKFEDVIGMLLERLGFEDVVVTSKSNDGGIDVIGHLVVADVIRTRMAVQVKRWANNVQRPEIQRVRGSLGVHDQGLIITTGGFSSGAREEANKPNAVLVAVMDGTVLLDQLIEHGIGVEKSPVTILELSSDLSIDPND